jgi:hypothetical protein
MTMKQLALVVICVVPPAYLAVLLLFDVKYFDPESKAFSVPIYPFPVYLKLALAIISCCVVAGLLVDRWLSSQKPNQ